METNNSSNQKKRLGIALALLLSSLIFIGFLYNSNSNLKTKLNTEKLKQDSVLSTKLLLDKEILGLTMDINSLKGKNAKLDSVLVQTSLKLDEKVRVITRLVKENATVKKLQQELKQLKNTRNELNRQLDEITSDYRKLSNENGKLKKQIESLEDELANAKEPKPTVGFAAQNFRIELQKRNHNKLTVRSRWTKNIQIGFDLNSGESKNNEETVYVKILDPAGFVITPNLVPVSIKNEKITYSSIQKVQLNGTSKRIIVDVKPDKKMKNKGVYKIMVYHARDGLIGSSEIRTN